MLLNGSRISGKPAHPLTNVSDLLLQWTVKESNGMLTVSSNFGDISSHFNRKRFILTKIDRGHHDDRLHRYNKLAGFLMYDLLDSGEGEGP